jgi:hypothetical protein
MMRLKRVWHGKVCNGGKQYQTRVDGWRGHMLFLLLDFFSICLAIRNAVWRCRFCVWTLLCHCNEMFSTLKGTSQDTSIKFVFGSIAILLHKKLEVNRAKIPRLMIPRTSLQRVVKSLDLRCNGYHRYFCYIPL